MHETSWDDLRFFLAVARHGTLALAARELGVNASTASRRIQALEKALRVRLFLRTREGLRPSAAGTQLRQRLVKLEPELTRLVGGELAPAETVAGTVRIATTEALAAYLVDRGLCSLKDEHPGLVLELMGGNRPVDLARGEADLAVRVTRPEGASLKVRQLQAQGFAVYGASGYLRQRGRPRSARELAGHDVLVVGGELAVLPEARWMEGQPGARIILRTNSMPALVAATRRGVGLAVLPMGWATVEPELERLFELPEVPRRPMWLVIQPESWERAGVRVVANRLKELLDPGPEPRAPGTRDEG